MTTKKEIKSKKKQSLRNNEYYDIQEKYDLLYKQSLEGKTFKNLIDIIKDEDNILLAYRNIKKNKGSKTGGTSKQTILDIAKDDKDKYVKYIRSRLDNYYPQSVRRVEIPKYNGKTRPLGIPTIEDRLIQQCIKQVLEPICEAKFYNYSYGFRPNRNTHHAIAKCYSLINRQGLHYVVDVDIKGFFDNVNHGKLLKQMWTLGIRDKNLICIISKMLKAEIQGIGIPTKGTPQGGILSPLLSNIVLNELDWWVSSQWENVKTKHNYSRIREDKGNTIDNGNKYQSLKRTTKLKEMYIVRYADDFKIFCRTYENAQKIYIAVKEWLDKRLGLEISPEKSKIVNLRKNYFEFLGFKLKAKPKRNKYVCQSHVSDKAKERIKKGIKEKIKWIKRKPDTININNYNSMILGVHQYYKIATNVSLDFRDIAFDVKRFIDNKLRTVASNKGIKNKTFMKFYGDYNWRTYNVLGIKLYPIQGIKTKPPMNFSSVICNYTQEGRDKVHQKLKGINPKMIQYLLENPSPNQSIEYNDNRISKYVGQNGVCGITGKYLQKGKMDCHHIKPKSQNGSDEYDNLIFVTTDVHKLIHATLEETVEKYLKILNLNKTQLTKINKFRKLVGNYVIV